MSRKAKAFRRPASKRDLASLMRFYADGRKERDFESGIASALEAILASPYFIFRMEKEPEIAKPGGSYRVADLDLDPAWLDLRR